jgi:hypothetical protein
MLGKHSATELYPQPKYVCFVRQGLPYEALNLPSAGILNVHHHTCLVFVSIKMVKY